MSVEESKREYCNLKFEYLKRVTEAELQYNKSKNTFIKLLKILFGISWKSLGKSLAADVIAVASSMSAQVVAAYAVAASSAAQEWLKKIFDPLFRILMSGPEVIFSLIRLPLDQARDHTLKEAKYLLDAEKNFDNVLRLMSKWLSGLSDNTSYNQMKQAKPFIDKAVSAINHIFVTTAGDISIDQGQLDVVIKSITTAADITMPQSFISNKINYESNLAVNTDKIYSSKLAPVQAKYNEDRAVLVKEWNDEAKKVKNVTPYQFEHQNTNTITDYTTSKINATIVSSIDTYIIDKIEAIDRIYKAKLDRLTDKFVSHRDQLYADAKAQAAGNVIVDTFSHGSNLIEEMKRDRDKIISELKLMASNIKTAFIEYKQSQLYTGFVYTGVERLKGVINLFITISKTTGNYAAWGPEKSTKGAKFLLDKTNDMFAKDIAKWESGDQSTVKMAVDLAVGNYSLRTTSCILNCTFTQSLINSVNFDEDLGAERDRYEQFRSDIYDIYDFNGKLGLWGTNTQGSLTDITKYTDLISRVTLALASAPAAMFSSSQVDKIAFRAKLVLAKTVIKQLRVHNTRVYIVLTSYDPPNYEMIGELKNILAGVSSLLSIGLMAMSVSDLMAAFESGLKAGYKGIDCSKYATTDKEKEAERIVAAEMEARNIDNIAAINGKSFIEVAMESTSDYNNYIIKQASAKIKMKSGRGDTLNIDRVSVTGKTQRPDQEGDRVNQVNYDPNYDPNFTPMPYNPKPLITDDLSAL